jgi:uncharacterized membrane protein YphA (DoxX/SURF4 family)
LVSATFKALLSNKTGVSAIPPLDLQARPAPAPAPDWLADHLAAPEPQRSQAVVESPVAAAAPQPVEELVAAPAMPPPPPIFFEHNPLQERLLAGGAVAAMLGLVAGLVMGVMPATVAGAGLVFLAVANLLFWHANYQRDTAVVMREQVRAEMVLLGDQQAKLAHNIRKQERERDKGLRKQAAPARKLEKQLEQAKADEQAELNRLQKQMQVRMDSLHAQLQTSQRKTDEALRKCKVGADTDMAELRRQIINLGQAEADELERRLRVRQEQFVLMALYQYAIEEVQFPGLTKSVKARLRAAGIATAADMDQHAAAMAEIAPAHVAALTDWRKYLETQARTVAPSKLQPSEATVVQTAYARRKQHLEGELQRRQARLHEEVLAFRASGRAKQEALNKQMADAQASLIQQEQQLRQRYAQQSAQIDGERARAMQRASPQLQKVLAQLDDSNRQVAGLEAKQAQLRARLEDEYGVVNFRNYVRWVLLGRDGIRH